MTITDLAPYWREALLGVVVLLMLYVFVVYRRLRRLRQQAAGVQSVPVASADSESAPETSTPGDALTDPPGIVSQEADFPWNEPPAPGENAALDGQRLLAMEAEVGELRKVLADLQEELGALREEVRLKVERVQAAHHVAPIYGDAMQMAVAGYDAAAIAERCGVARAEAELVVALIRNREDPESGMRER